MKKLIFDEREYEVTENEDEYILRDISNEPFKFHMRFSKDQEKNKIAKEGLTIFFTEVFS